MKILKILALNILALSMIAVCPNVYSQPFSQDSIIDHCNEDGLVIERLDPVHLVKSEFEYYPESGEVKIQKIYDLNTGKKLLESSEYYRSGLVKSRIILRPENKSNIWFRGYRNEIDLKLVSPDGYGRICYLAYKPDNTKPLEDQKTFTEIKYTYNLTGSIIGGDEAKNAREIKTYNALGELMEYSKYDVYGDQVIHIENIHTIHDLSGPVVVQQITADEKEPGSLMIQTPENSIEKKDPGILPDHAYEPADGGIDPGSLEQTSRAKVLDKKMAECSEMRDNRFARIKVDGTKSSKAADKQ